METTHCVTGDKAGMHVNLHGRTVPALMGAVTLIGNQVFHHVEEDLGEIMADKGWASGIHAF